MTHDIQNWLVATVHVDPQRNSDIVLATYEALANCADHAYQDPDNPSGTMTVEATYDTPAATVRICITDHGRWIDPNTRPADTTRGRGLLLMRALSDDITVNGTSSGTTVCLHFENCPATPQPLPDNPNHRATREDHNDPEAPKDRADQRRVSAP